MMHQFRSIRRAAMLVASAFALTACTSDEHGHEAEVEFMRVTLGGAEVLVNSSGGVSGGPLTIPADFGTSLSVEFLTSDMTPAIDADDEDYQADFVAPAGFTFARTGPFAGVLTATGVTSGTHNVQISLLHIPESHADFGAFGVPVTVQQPPTLKDR